jgi:hypothetical protein
MLPTLNLSSSPQVRPLILITAPHAFMDPQNHTNECPDPLTKEIAVALHKKLQPLYEVRLHLNEEVLRTQQGGPTDLNRVEGLEANPNFSKPLFDDIPLATLLIDIHSFPITMNNYYRIKGSTGSPGTMDWSPKPVTGDPDLDLDSDLDPARAVVLLDFEALEAWRNTTTTTTNTAGPRREDHYERCKKTDFPEQRDAVLNSAAGVVKEALQKVQVDAYISTPTTVDALKHCAILEHASRLGKAAVLIETPYVYSETNREYALGLGAHKMETYVSALADAAIALFVAGLAGNNSTKVGPRSVTQTRCRVRG